ncbi:uncharacterized protein LOC144441198 isoform X2 [Glandiceps talaboti]
MVLDMETGAPSLKILEECVGMMNTATVNRLQSDEGHIFQYGVTQGDGKFRIQMSKFLTEKYQDDVSSEDLMVTCGASHGLYMIGTLLFNRGDIVFVEDPTYFIALDMFKEMGMTVVPVPSADSLNIDDLDKLLSEYQQKSSREITDTKPYWAMVYLVPTFNNPRGFCLPEEKCRKVIQLARKYNVLVVCDDVYNLLSYIPGDKPEDVPLPAPKRLFAYDDKLDPEYKGNVISNCTFSKILGPGLRCGWVEAPVRSLNVLRFSGITRSGGGWNNYTSGILASVIELGLLSEHVLKLQKKYKRHLDAMCDVLTKEMPPEVKFTKPQGGYFIWVVLPESVSVTELREYCLKEYKVTFAPGPSFSIKGNFQNCMRLAFTYNEEEDLVCGLKKVCTATQKFCKEAAQKT